MDTGVRSLHILTPDGNLGSLAIDALQSPSELRRRVDELASGVPVWISAEQSAVSFEAGVEPWIEVDANVLHPMDVERAFRRLGMSYMLSGELAERFGSSVGDLEIKRIGERVEVLTPGVEDGDRAMVSLTQSVGTVVRSAGMLVYQGGWKRECRIPQMPEPQDLEVETTAPGMAFDWPACASFGYVQWLRPGMPGPGDTHFCISVAVEDWFTFENQHGGWYNHVDGHRILGRQDLPTIHPWTGRAFLPARVDDSATWLVRSESGEIL